MKKRVQTRLDAPDIEDVSELENEWEMTEAATLRRLIRMGIRVHKESQKAKQSRRARNPIMEKIDREERDSPDSYDALLIERDDLQPVQFSDSMKVGGGPDE